MLLPRQLAYAIRLMVEIALCVADAPVSTRTLSARMRIPRAFLHKTASQLSRSNLLTSQRGVGGGLALARPAQNITVLDVALALKVQLELIECTMGGKRCRLIRRCAVRDLLCDTTAVVRRKFARTTIADLAARQRRLITEQRKRKTRRTILTSKR